jgi:hypothetical protein
MCLLTCVSLSSSVTGVDVEIHWARIGTVLTRSPDMRTQQETEGEEAYWSLGHVLSFNICEYQLLELDFKRKKII